MKKKIAIMLSAMMIMYPTASKADMDLLSMVQDIIGEIQERLNLVLVQYTGMQVDLAMLVTDRGAFLDNLRDQAKALALDKAMALADNIKIGTFEMPGITDKITTGLYVTPELQNALAATYLKRSEKNVDQFADAIAEFEKNNDCAIENLAALFAEAIVHRKEMEKEATTKEDGTNETTANQDASTDRTTELVKKYMDNSKKANERWIKVMAATAKQEEHVSRIRMTEIKLDELSDITGNLEDNVVAPVNLAQLRGNGASLLSIYNAGSSAFNNIQSGNYAGALSDIAGSAIDINGEDNNIVSSVVTGANSVQDAYYSAEGGDWGGALGALGGGAGGILGENGFEDIGGAIAGSSGMVGSAVNSAVEGDWVDAVAQTGMGAGGIVGATGNEDWGTIIGAGGALVDSSGQIASGDYFGGGENAVDALADMLQGSQNLGERKYGEDDSDVGEEE